MSIYTYRIFYKNSTVLRCGGTGKRGPAAQKSI